MAKIRPRAMLKSAANNTRYSAGSIKVKVWAGIQKSGIVRLNTKFHCSGERREIKDSIMIAMSSMLFAMSNNFFSNKRAVHNLTTRFASK